LDEATYRQGHQAFQDGQKAYQNPYVLHEAHGCKEVVINASNAWNAGWMDACWEAAGKVGVPGPDVWSNAIMDAPPDAPPRQPWRAPTVEEVDARHRQSRRAIDVG
jgi:hypothetical protein